jgi:hypothetical protein
MAKILRGAIAYRQDCNERESWANARREAIPVACPSSCWVEYDLFVTEEASGEDALKWVEALLDTMEGQHPKHDSIITL